jgi:hypothetical protein
VAGESSRKQKRNALWIAQRAKPKTMARAVPTKPAVPKLPSDIALLGFADVEADADVDAEVALVDPEAAGFDTEEAAVVEAETMTVLVAATGGVVATVPPGVVIPASWLLTSGEKVPVMPVKLLLNPQGQQIEASPFRRERDKREFG